MRKSPFNQILRTAIIPWIALPLFALAQDKPKYSNFPSETAVAKTENGRRILHEDSFSTDTLQRKEHRSRAPHRRRLVDIYNQPVGPALAATPRM